MQKPNGYDDVQGGGDFTPINLGGHFAIIKRVKETTSKNGKPMIQVAIDFSADDEQPGYFMKSFQDDNRPDKKWPYQGTQYIMTEDQSGKCSRSLKSFITSVERSNNSECPWGASFETWFTNKKVGVVYGEVEDEYNGELKTRRRIRYFYTYDKAKEAAVPDKKQFRPPSGSVTTSPDGFMNIPDTMQEEIPF